jgi:monoamine oxidase
MNKNNEISIIIYFIIINMSGPYDIIIIGSGIAGLYSAFNIKKNNPNIRFLILEKYKKNWIGGRVNSESFYGVDIVTGAGVGRKDTNPLLIELMNELNVPFLQLIQGLLLLGIALEIVHLEIHQNHE